MRKIILIVLICFSVSSLYAKKVTMIQGIFTVDNDKCKSDEFESSHYFFFTGLSLTHYRGGLLGWQSRISYAVPTETYLYTIDNGNGQNDAYLTHKDKWKSFHLDLATGPGLFLDLPLLGIMLSPQIKATLLNIEDISPLFYLDYEGSYHTLTLEAGLGLSTLLQLGSINLNATAYYAYDLYKELLGPTDFDNDLEYLKSDDITIGIGLGWKH